MAILSKARSAVRSVASKVSSLVSRGGIVSPQAQAKISSSAMSVAPKGPAGTSTNAPNATSATTGKPVYVSPSGQQFSTPSSSWPSTVSGSTAPAGTGVASDESLSGVGGLGTPLVPRTIGSSSLSSSPSVSLPSAYGGGNVTGSATSTGAGALASIQAGMTSPSAYTSDGKTDPTTGKPVKDPNQFDAKSLIEMMAELDTNAPTVDRRNIYQQEEEAVQFKQKQQEVNNYTAQLNAIQAKAQADQLSIVGQGRGIPEAIIGGQQEQIAREAAIRALPVAAQLSAAQGNLQLAQDHLDTMYKLRVQDAEDKYKRWESTRNAVIPILTASEKRRLDVIDRQKENEREDAKIKAANEFDLYKLRLSKSLSGSSGTISIAPEDKRILVGAGFSTNEIANVQNDIAESGITAVLANPSLTSTQKSAIRKIYGVTEEERSFLTYDYLEKYYGDAQLKDDAKAAGFRHSLTSWSTEKQNYIDYLLQQIELKRQAGMTDKEIFKDM